MAKNGAGTVILVLVVVAVLLLFSGQIFQFIGNITGYEGSIPSLTDIINQFLAALGLGGGGGTDATGSTSVAFVVYFTDGTKQEINQDMSYSLMPFTITFSGKTISRVQVDVKAKLTGTGVTKWNSSVSQHIELYKKPETTPKTSSTGNFTSSGSAWVSGDIKTIATVTIQGSVLDQAVGDFGNGDYLLEVSADVSITVNGATTYDAQALRGGLDITYSNGHLQSIAPNLPTRGFT